jgi:hypothetical protein
MNREQHMGWARVGVAAVVSVALVGLGGCAVAPVVADKTSPPTQRSTPVPTPTAAAIVAPSTRIPVGCAALVDPAVIGAFDPALALSESAPPSRPYTRAVARQQAGLLECVWSTPGATDSVDITVAAGPDVVAGFWQHGGPDTIAPFRVGDPSWGFCYKSTSCQASVIAGDYWVSIITGAVTTTAQQPMEVLRGLATSVITALTGAGAPLPAWTPPTTVWSPVVSCADLGAAVPMNDVMAAGPGVASDWNGPGDENPIDQWTTRNSVFYNCAWQWSAAPVNDGLLVVQIVPGAEWVEPQLESSAGVTSVPLTVPGATDAAYRCDSNSCWADAIIDHSWVQLSGVTNSLPDAQAKLTRALTALAAYRGGV